jgi:hypothetical protein
MARIEFLTKVPSCFTEPQYEAWKEAARQAIPTWGPCTDCTPGYQARMKIAGKCEHPEIKFEYDDDEAIYGRLPRKEGIDDQD